MYETFKYAIANMKHLKLETKDPNISPLMIKDRWTKDRYSLYYDEKGQNITFKLYPHSDRLSSKERSFRLGREMIPLLLEGAKNSPKLRIKSLFSPFHFINETPFFVSGGDERTKRFHFKSVISKVDLYGLLSFIPLLLFFMTLPGHLREGESKGYLLFVFCFSLCSPVCFLMYVSFLIYEFYCARLDYTLLNKKSNP